MQTLRCQMEGMAAIIERMFLCLSWPILNHAVEQPQTGAADEDQRMKKAGEMHQAREAQMGKGLLPGCRCRGAWAFTLVELLVVIAIIAILASLLLPALKRARERAKQVVCLSHQRQIYLATVMYHGDFQNLMPTTGVPKRAFGFTASSGSTSTNRIISFGLLAWHDYIKVQEVLTCADTVPVPLQVGHWLYPHLANHPLRSVYPYADNFHIGHRPAFALPMRGKQNFSPWYSHGGVSGYAFRRRGNMLVQWQSGPSDFVDGSKVTLATINCKTIMVCNQTPGDPYETCHQARGSNLLFYDGSAKWGDFQGQPRSSYYGFQYVWSGSVFQGYTDIWNWAEAQF